MTLSLPSFCTLHRCRRLGATNNPLGSTACRHQSHSLVSLQQYWGCRPEGQVGCALGSCRCERRGAAFRPEAPGPGCHCWLALRTAGKTGLSSHQWWTDVSGGTRPLRAAGAAGQRCPGRTVCPRSPGSSCRCTRHISPSEPDSAPCGVLASA